MSNEEDIEYTEDFITKCESAFGKGFLSPGGEEEVSKIVEGINLHDKEILDIGVGIGGPACILVNKHNATSVLGIDVENPVLNRAAETVAHHNLQGRIILQRVSPGPLPFADNSFDVVFSKDSIIHIPDKEALFNEVYRVLKPGGWLAMSDWYCSPDPFTEEMKVWVEATGLSFAMTPIENDGSLLENAGFIEHATLDRNTWFTDYSHKLLKSLSGTEYDRLVATLGKEGAEDQLLKAERRAIISAQGQLRPGHLRGQKPI